MPAPTNPNMGQLDSNQILQRAFDEASDKFRVDSSVSVTSITGEVAVEIDAADGDNIAIANAAGTKKVTITTIGPIEALDVNVAASALPTGAATSANQTNKTQFTHITDGTDDLLINTSGSLNAVTSGQRTSGVITHVSLTSAGWTALPTTPLTNRNNITVQNISGNGNIVLWNYSASASATEGIRIEDRGSKTSDLSAAVIVYGRMLSGSGTVVVDEVS